MSDLAAARDFLRKAETALGAADLLLKTGDTEGACNRAYYAMFDAARAALLVRGHRTDEASSKTHRGLIAVSSRPSA